MRIQLLRRAMDDDQAFERGMAIGEERFKAEYEQRIAAGDRQSEGDRLVDLGIQLAIRRFRNGEIPEDMPPSVRRAGRMLVRQIVQQGRRAC